MFDTNIFNEILDGNLDISKIMKENDLFVTHIQRDEINATKKVERKSALLSVFVEICDPEKKSSTLPTENFVLGVSRLDQAKLSSVLPTESFVWDTSNWNEAKWSDGSLFCKIEEKLNAKNKGKPNNRKDALIAETAILNGLSLVTHDSDLFFVVTAFKGSALNIYEVVKQCKSSC